MIFEILIDDSLLNLATDIQLSPIENKRVLSLINDFEDGKWRYNKFQEFIWDNIAETALSENERNGLIENPFTSLARSAKNLRLTDVNADDKGRGSELAEIVLYGIMKHHYKALPVVPKIFYKQNAQDFAKGSDSVHIVIEGDNEFSLWFGEAKFYNSIEDVRLNEVVNSVKNSLQTKKLKKENSIITNLCDLDTLLIDVNLKQKIKETLSAGMSIDDLKPRLHIPILLLHQCEITCRCTDLTNEYRNEIKEYHKQRAMSYFAKQIAKLSDTVHKYSEIKFHIILFPVPAKDDLVKTFVANVDHYKRIT